MEDYPSNSQRRQPVIKGQVAPAPQGPVVAKVTTGGVRKKEKSLFRKAKEAFVGNSDQSIGEHIVLDVLIPAAKSMIFESATQGLNQKLWGTSGPVRGGFRPPTVQGAWTNYQQAQMAPPGVAPGLSRQARATHDFSELVFDNRIDAVEVLNGLAAIVAEYEVASVRHFYNLCGETAAFTDENYGWTDLTGAHVRPVGRGGYQIVLPQPIQIN